MIKCGLNVSGTEYEWRLVSTKGLGIVTLLLDAIFHNIPDLHPRIFDRQVSYSTFRSMSCPPLGSPLFFCQYLVLFFSIAISPGTVQVSTLYFGSNGSCDGSNKASNDSSNSSSSTITAQTTYKASLKSAPGVSAPRIVLQPQLDCYTRLSRIFGDRA